MKEAEEDHIKKVGEKHFHKVLALANCEVRQDSRLTGLDKIRGAIAFEAALQATGFDKRPFKLPKGVGNPNAKPEQGLPLQTIAEEVLSKAINAAIVAV